MKPSPLRTAAFAGVSVSNSSELVVAVRDGAENASIEIAAGSYELEAPLEPKSGMSLSFFRRGALTSGAAKSAE